MLTAAGSTRVGETLTPERFGAKGDGHTNDTFAFAALSARVNARGGGTIVLRPVTYIVGAQQRTPTGSFSPVDILHFESCTAPIIVKGNGARLRAAAGLRFGTFDLETGAPAPDGLPFRQFIDETANAYPGMIYVNKCSDLVEISDLELDGNVMALHFGGRSSKALGWEAQAHGVWFHEHRGPARLTRLHLHHHAMDGVIFTDPLDRAASTITSDVICEYNGRNGCSITSGCNYHFERCEFRHSGKAGVRNAPAAGVDIEAGAGPIRNVSFFDCEFSDNSGMALVAGGGDSDNLSFARCKFVGTDKWAAWPSKPHTKFSNCTFVGSIIHACGDPDPSRAAQFLDCTFTDSPALSPSGKVFIDRGSIAWLTDSRNALFSRCRFRLTGQAGLPRSVGVIYADCQMSQVSPAPSHPQGTYLGTTTITGNANLAGSDIRGTVIRNGRQLPRTG